MEYRGKKSKKDQIKTVAEVLKALQKTNLKKANLAYAEKMLGRMIKYAKYLTPQKIELNG